MNTLRVGLLVKEWRARRRRSQLDLALEVGVSSRHLSFVETGRSRPSPELILAIAHHLEVPLRDRNAMLLAAGYAPRYSQIPIEDERMERARRSVQRLLDAHHPYPGVAVDRQWNVVLSNQAAGLLTAGIPEHVLVPRVNVFRVCLHPDGLAARTLNFEEWAGYLLAQMRRTIRATADRDLQDLEREVLGWENVRQVIGRRDSNSTNDEPEILIPLRVAVGEHEMSLFTTLTTFGTPRDVTLDELVVELFYPSDDTTEQLLRTIAGKTPAGF